MKGKPMRWHRRLSRPWLPWSSAKKHRVTLPVLLYLEIRDPCTLLSVSSETAAVATNALNDATAQTLTTLITFAATTTLPGYKCPCRYKELLPYAPACAGAEFLRRAGLPTTYIAGQEAEPLVLAEIESTFRADACFRLCEGNAQEFQR